MTNLASIVTLLQLVLSLLTNSSTAQSPAAQALASQAITMATQAINASTETQAGASLGSTPQIVTPEDIQAEQMPSSTSISASIASVSSPIASCSLSVQITSVNQLPYSDSFQGANVSISIFPAGGVLQEFGIENGSLSAAQPRTLASTQTYITSGFEPIYEVTQSNGANCYTFFPDYWHNGKIPGVGDVSTSLEPAGFPFIQQ